MIKIASHIAKAIAQKKPIVALESTIISHGMPYPDNVKTALEVEKVIIDNGAIPATIGIIDGIAVIGMNKEEIEQFGKRENIQKVSRRDLPLVFALKRWGATTVAATMILAEQAGIEIFVTGGIGGVHLGAEQTLDISADLEELSQTEVAVVCAGIKSILDLEKTMQYLETKGVPVYGYQTQTLPAFFVTDSGIKLDYAINDYQEAALIVKTKRDAKLKGGMLITVPVPKQYSMPKKEMDLAIQAALNKAKEQNIKGQEVTPYLLKEVNQLSQGASLRSNIALIKNNAKVGAQIAKALKQR